MSRVKVPKERSYQRIS